MPSLDNAVEKIYRKLSVLCRSIQFRKEQIYTSLIEAYCNGSNYIEFCIDINKVERICILYHIIYIKMPNDILANDIGLIYYIDRKRPIDREVETILKLTDIIIANKGEIKLLLSSTALKYFTKYIDKCNTLRYKTLYENPWDETID